MAVLSRTCFLLQRKGKQGVMSPAYLLAVHLLLLVLQKSTALPELACRFEQHFLSETGEKGNPNNDPDCQFQIIADEFLDVIGSEPKLLDVGQARASQGPVYSAKDNMIYYTSKRDPGGWSTRIEKIAFKTFQAGETPNEPETFADGSPVATGLAIHPNGSLLAAFQGVGGSRPTVGQIALYNLTDSTGQFKPFADNFCGSPLNSPHDLVVTKGGEVYFTDPSYAFAGGFKGQPILNEAVYRVRKDGVVEVVATELQRPKAIALTGNGRRIYISESAAWTGNLSENPKMDLSAFDPNLPHNIWSFDVNNGRLANKQFFTTTMNFGGYGTVVPMSMKTDTSGRVYVATFQGVQVYSSSGSPIGVIKLQGVTAIGWGGKENDHMIILDEERVRAFKLGTCCGVVSSSWRLRVPSLPTFFMYFLLLVLSMCCLDPF